MGIGTGTRVRPHVGGCSHARRPSSSIQAATLRELQGQRKSGSGGAVCEHTEGLLVRLRQRAAPCCAKVVRIERVRQERAPCHFCNPPQADRRAHLSCEFRRLMVWIGWAAQPAEERVRERLLRSVWDESLCMPTAIAMVGSAYFRRLT